jgi:hypothetical protein
MKPCVIDPVWQVFPPEADRPACGGQNGPPDRGSSQLIEQIKLMQMLSSAQSVSSAVNRMESRAPELRTDLPTTLKLGYAWPGKLTRLWWAGQATRHIAFAWLLKPSPWFLCGQNQSVYFSFISSLK